MVFTDIKSPIQSDLLAVNALLREQLHSSVALVNTVAEHIIQGGGKRIRPMLVLLSAHALGYTGEKAVELAAIIELIHTATLLHDDVVDHSSLRRGSQTANAIWGNAASVLVGDFLYSRSFQMMVKLQNLSVMDILANTTNRISEGEVLQLLYVHNPDVTEDQYFDVIERKTAILFRAAGQLGALIANGDPKTIEHLANYGSHLGLAFQLIDDVIDYRADINTTGKNLGDDLAEGKPTLPLIYALKHSSSTQQALLRQTILEGKVDQLPAIQEIIETTGALDYVKQRAHHAADAAIQCLSILPDSVYKTALADLAMFAVERNS
jgi:octaprenyl-diphosphate synthase